MSQLILNENTGTPSQASATTVKLYVDNSGTPQLKTVDDANTVTTQLDNANVFSTAITGKMFTFAAGSNTVSPAKWTSGTNLSSAAAGATEYDGTCFYSTPVASARGLWPSIMYSIVPAGDFALLTTSGVQSAFPTTGDVWTLQASTAYFFEGHYQITKTTTTVTVAMAFAAAASLSVTSIEYFVCAFNGAVNTTIATVAMTNVNTIASTVVNATSTAATSIYFKGIIRVNVGGTLTPQVSWSANTTVPVMKVDSFITFTPLGTNTSNILGNVA